VCRVSFYNFIFLNPFVQIKDLARCAQDASRNSCRIPFKVSVSCEGLNFYSGVEKYSSILGYGPMRIKKKSFPRNSMQQALPKSECLAVTTISQPRRLGFSASYFPILTDNEISMYTSKPHRPKFHEYHSSDSVFVTWRQPDMTNFIAKILPLFFATSPKLEYAFSISNN
jgi:hypothetical protein